MTVPGDLLDLILIVLAAAFAVAGYRQGFIIGACSFGGFLIGAVIGTYLAPGISASLAATANLRAVLAILIVFIGAVLGLVTASALGVALRSRVRAESTSLFDAIGGAVINVVAVLLLAWMIGSFVAYAPPFPGLASQVNRSVILRTVDRMIPQGARPGFSALRRLVTTGPFVQVFGALGAENALNVKGPDPAVLNSPALAMARASIVKIEGVASGCSKTIEGSGFVIGPDHVITNAHVVAGLSQDPEVYPAASAGYPARVVLFDPERDVAVLYVPGLTLPALRLAGQAPFGGDAIVAGYPLDASFTAVPARVGAAETASGPDIYQNSQVTRDIYPIRAHVLPGNSGGPLLAPDGSVYGMVFAAATTIPDTGYALTSGEISGDLAAGVSATRGVPLGTCL